MPTVKGQGRARGSKVVHDEAIPSSEVRGDLLDNEISFDVSPRPDPSGESRNIIVSKSPTERAVIALKSTKAETQLRELVAKSADITAVIDPAGRDQAHRIAMDLKNARVNIKNTGKAAREDAQAFSAAVIAEEKRLIAITEAEEERVFKLRDDYDSKVKAEKEEAERKIRELVAERRAKIEAIANLPRMLAGASSAQLVEELQKLVAMQPTAEEFDSMLAEMLLTIETVGSALSALLQGAREREEAERRRAEEQEAERFRVAKEAEENRIRAAELAAQQAEMDRKLAEQAEAERLARVAAEQQRQAMDHINVLRSKAETAATGALALGHALEYVETVATEYDFGAFSSMVKMARDLAADTLRARIRAAVEAELPALIEEAIAENAAFDAKRAPVPRVQSLTDIGDKDVGILMTSSIDLPPLHGHFNCSGDYVAPITAPVVEPPDFAAMDEVEAVEQADSGTYNSEPLSPLGAFYEAVRALRFTRTADEVRMNLDAALADIQEEIDNGSQEYKAS